MKRVLFLALLGAAVYSPGASAGTECEGLQSCVRVVGPWVQVPVRSTPTYYRLSCPASAPTVGGLDADLAGGGVNVTFLGELGGPVGPGVTTKRSIVFVARATRGRIATFRPRLGCIPGAGGGGRARTSFEPTRWLAAVNAVAPASRSTWRVTSARVRTPGQTARVSCRPAERLLSFGSAIVFRRVRPPTAAQLASVRTAARRQGARAVVATAVGTPPAGVRVELQVQAVCA